MANKPTQPIFPLGLGAEEQSTLAGILNTGTIEHGPDAVLTLPEGSTTAGLPSSVRYNADSDEFEGFYENGGWLPLGGGGIRWEVLPHASTATLSEGRGYLVDNSTGVSTVVFPSPTRVGDSVTVCDLYGKFSLYPLTIDPNGRPMYGSVEPMTLSTDSVSATFTWSGDARGWIVTAGVGLGQGRVYSRTIFTETLAADTAQVTLATQPSIVDVYVDGKRLLESKYSLNGYNVDFSPSLTSGSELQIIQYVPIQLGVGGGSGGGTVITWIYNGGSAVGGETEIELDVDAEDVSEIYISGSRQQKGLGFTYDSTAKVISLADELDAGDEVVVVINGDPTLYNQIDRTPNEVARSANVPVSQVIMTSDTVTKLDGKTVIYDVVAQKIWGLPSGIPTGASIVSVSGGTLTYAPGNVVVSLNVVPSVVQLPANGGASVIGTGYGMTLQQTLDADFLLFKKVLAAEGYNLVGSFQNGGTVTKKFDAVWNIANGKFYCYTGASAFPVTVPASSSPTVDWTETTFTASFVVGNDVTTPYYDFSELSDALSYLSTLNGKNNMNDQTTFRIVVPAGRHNFKSIRLRGVDLANVQIWGAGSANTTVVCTPNNTTDGIWWSMRFAHFADMVGIRFEWAASVTSPTDASIACQRWYGSGDAPWLPNQTSNFFDMLSSTFGRMSDLLAVADTTGAGVRLGAFLNVQCSIINQIDGVEARNLRDFIVAYNGSIIGSGYNVIRGTQVFNYLVNHESTVTIRLAAASAFNTTSTVRVGSVFVDTMRGYTAVVAGVTGSGITRFDTLFLQNAGEIVCGIASNLYSIYNKIQESFGDGSTLVSKLPITNSDILLSNNKIQLLVDGITDINNISRKYGSLSYTGNGGTSQTVAIPAMARKLNIRNRTTNMSITLIIDQVLLNSSGTNCAWFNSPASNLVVYTGDFNTNGVAYDVVWER